MVALDPRLIGAEVVVSVSGGKDSAATSLYLTELGVEHRRMFLDTGWEAEVTYEYLRGPLEAKLGPIESVTAPRSMVELVRWKGMFPGRTARFCTEELKIEPAAAYLVRLADELGREVVNAVGVRAAESADRAKLDEWEWAEHFDSWTWRPILRWTEAEVIEIHRRHGLEPNPLYLRGHGRVGCWPCIFARKGEIRRIAASDPGRIDLIERLEAEVFELGRMRYAARGQTYESLGYKPPSMLLVPIPGTHRRKMAPIREVVSWANTADPPRWAEDPEPPCYRWGLCEVDGSERRTALGLPIGRKLCDRSE